MLIENKFIYISLPRCASTSFLTSCVRSNLDIKHVNEIANIHNQLELRNKKLSDIDYHNFMHEVSHIHEPIDELKKKFGGELDIIAVKRNKYDRFISLWKHILHEMDLKEHVDTFKICSNLSIDDILFYNGNDLNIQNEYNVVDEFKKRYGLTKLTSYGENMIKLLIRPYSYYHQHDNSIIWFDFNELYKLEEWVSNKLNIDFKLININSSKQYQSNLILNDEFKEKYDSIYLKYDEIKSVKTMI